MSPIHFVSKICHQHRCSHQRLMRRLKLTRTLYRQDSLNFILTWSWLFKATPWQNPYTFEPNVNIGRTQKLVQYKKYKNCTKNVFEPRGLNPIFGIIFLVHFIIFLQLQNLLNPNQPNRVRTISSTNLEGKYEILYLKDS